MKQFLLKSTVLTLIIFTFGTILYSTFLNPYFVPVLPVAVLFFFLVTNLVHAYLLKNSEKSNSRFTSQYMAASFLKMFFYLAVAIVYVMFNKEAAKPFFINFLLLYVVYTSFEVYELFRVVKHKG